jgi:predicted nucleic acid-binding Zn ribbon protein
VALGPPFFFVLPHGLEFWTSVSDAEQTGPASSFFSRYFPVEVAMTNNAKRNRAMLSAYEASRTIEQLAEDHGLAIASITSILTVERHRRRESPEPFYRALRRSREAMLDKVQDRALLPGVK